MPAKNIIRVVVIEDDEIIRNSFESIINESEKYICTAAYDTCEDAIKNLSGNEPQIILIDSSLTGISGLEGIERINNAYSKGEIILLTLLERDEQIYKALRAGASGYVSKNIKPEKLIEALDEILRGESSMSTGIAKIIQRSASRNITKLTSKEAEVLKRISEGKSYSTIAENLRTNKETIKSQIKNIYRKLPFLVKS